VRPLADTRGASRAAHGGHGSLFESSDPFLFFDYFRIPYRVASRAKADASAGGMRWGRIRPVGQGRDRVPTLAWPLVAEAAGRGFAMLEWGGHRLAGIPIFGNVVRESATPRWVGRADGWRPTDAVVSASGERVASVWRHPDGSVVLPFDPGELLHNYWSERYSRAWTSPVRSRSQALFLNAYYRVRPAIPRRVQIAMRRVFARSRRPPPFPRWPVETALLDLCDWLFAEVVRLPREPVPWLAPWPGGHRWAVVLTHDVESGSGCANIELLRHPEREMGFRSSWNFVPLRYTGHEDAMAPLRAEGCEIGVHGLRHDGRDLASPRQLEARLPAMRAYAARWGAVGFRAPATQRVWEWMPSLGFEYDSSYPDTDPYEPQPGGCCSYFPYLNGTTVELPITMPQDHTLFAILQHPDASLWLEKIQNIKSWGGMALILTHPDYAEDRRVTEGYRRLLQMVREDRTAWQALPRDVSDWWRRRADSHLERGNGTWHVRGPASIDGTIRFARPESSALRPESDHDRSDRPARKE
jgi:hypothetical protein